MKQDPRRKFAVGLAVTFRDPNVVRKITMKQFMELSAYNELEPFTHVWDTWRIASIVQAVRNVLASKEEHLVKLEDCVLRVDENAAAPPKDLPARVAAVAQTVEEQIMIARIMAMIQAQLALENSPDR